MGEICAHSQSSEYIDCRRKLSSCALASKTVSSARRPRQLPPNRFFSLIGSLLLHSLPVNPLALSNSRTQHAARHESDRHNKANHAILLVAPLTRDHVTPVEA